ncbi:MAG: barstar family protein [Acidovorax sp.]|uniref:barstar family protein n=1 Tax=Acidovorax sp. TaxID=1872122 RepID=UPI00391A1AA8
MEVADEVRIDLRTVSNSHELHQLLMTALGFPTWYGRNWDAFWDAITGLVHMPRRLCFAGWTDFEQRLPHEAKHLRDSLSQMKLDFPAEAPDVAYGRSGTRPEVASG